MAAARGAERYIRVTVDAQPALNSLRGIERNVERTTGAVRNLALAMKGLVVFELVNLASQAASSFIEMADGTNQLSSNLENLTGSAEGARSVFDELRAIGDTYSVSTDALGSSFTRLRSTLDESTVSSEQILNILESTSGALAVTGASAEEASSSMTQMSQALASGRLQGDEFRSLAENAPVWLGALAQALGVSRGELKEMATAGELTTETIVGLSSEIADIVETQASAVAGTNTFDKALVRLGNAVGALFFDVKEGGGILDGFAVIIDSVTEAITDNEEIIKDLIGAIGALAEAFGKLASFIWGIVGPPLRFIYQTIKSIIESAEELGRRFSNFTFGSQLEQEANKLAALNQEQANLQNQLASAESTNKTVAEIERIQAALDRTTEQAKEAEMAIRRLGPQFSTTMPEAARLGSAAAVDARKEIERQKREEERLTKETELQNELNDARTSGVAALETQYTVAGAAADEHIKKLEEVKATQAEIYENAVDDSRKFFAALDQIEQERLAANEKYLTDVGRAFSDRFAASGGDVAEGFAYALQRGLSTEIPDGFVSDLLTGRGGSIDFSALIDDTAQVNLGKIFGEAGSTFGITAATDFGAALQKNATSAAFGQQIGSVVSSAIFSSTSGVGATFGGLAGGLAGAAIPGGAAVGSGLGALLGGGIESILGGGGDGIRQARAVFEFADGELSATASRLGQNSAAFFELVDAFDTNIEALVSTMDAQTRRVVENLNFTTDRSSSSSLDEFATKMGQVVTRILSEAASTSDEWARTLEGMWHQSGRNMDDFRESVARFMSVSNGLADAANRLAGSDVLTSMSDLVGLVKTLGETEAAVVTQNVNALDRMLENIKSESQKIAEAEVAISKTFSALGLAIPQSGDALRALVEGLDLTTVEGLRAASAIGSISSELESYISGLERQEQAIEDTAETTINFADLMQEALDSLISVQDSIGSWRDEVREFNLSDEELYNLRKSEIDELVKLLNYAELSPQEIAKTVSEIERLSREAWGLLTDEQRAAQQKELVSFLNEVETIATARLSGAIEDIKDASGTITADMKRIMAIFDEQVKRGAQRMQEAGGVVARDIRVISAHVDRYRQAANVLNQAATRNNNAAARLTGSVNQLSNVGSSFGGSAHGFRQSTISFHHSVNGFNHGVKTFVNSAHDLKRYVGTQTNRIEGNSARIRQLEDYNRGARDERRANVR